MTKQQTTYEWDIEVVDQETGDILEHHFSDKCPGIPSEPNCHLVLVKNVFRPIDEELAARIKKQFGPNHPIPEMDLHNREWAYVENGKLPAEFDGGSKVPVRFIRELEAA